MQSDRERTKSFWRDNAKFPLFVPEKRRKAIMKYGSLLIGIPAVIFIAGEKAGLDRMASAAMTLGIEFITLPAFFAYELYWTGGTAGAALKDEIAKLQSDDPAIADQEASALIDCVNKLSAIAESAKSGFPKVGPNASLHIVQETFIIGVKNDLEACLGECSKGVGGKYRTTLSTERIESVTDFNELMREIEGIKLKLMRAIESIGPN